MDKQTFKTVLAGTVGVISGIGCYAAATHNHDGLAFGMFIISVGAFSYVFND